MINLDKAALSTPFPGIENIIFESMKMHRPSAFGLGLVSDKYLSEKIEDISELIGFKAIELSFFNSSSAIIGFLAKQKKIYCSELEHKSVRRVCEPIHELQISSLDEQDWFVISARNNEIGKDISHLIPVLKERKCKLILDLNGADFSSEIVGLADAIFASASKWHAGTGLAMLASRLNIDAPSDRFSGFGLGTPNITGILALESAMRWMQKTKFRAETVLDYHSKFEDLSKELGWKVHGNANFIFAANVGVNGKAFCYECSEEGLFISTGAACNSGNSDNQIIKKLFGAQASEQNIRISWDRMTKADEISKAIEILKKVNVKFKQC